MNSQIAADCKRLLEAYMSGKLGQTKMPEDSNPAFADTKRKDGWLISLCRWR
jgi:hypothetical protein